MIYCNISKKKKNKWINFVTWTSPFARSSVIVPWDKRWYKWSHFIFLLCAKSHQQQLIFTKTTVLSDFVRFFSFESTIFFNFGILFYNFYIVPATYIKQNTFYTLKVVVSFSSHKIPNEQISMKDKQFIIISIWNF